MCGSSTERGTCSVCAVHVSIWERPDLSKNVASSADTTQSHGLWGFEDQCGCVGSKGRIPLHSTHAPIMQMTTYNAIQTLQG